MTFNEYLQEQSKKMDRVIRNCIKYFGVNKSDGKPRVIFPDDFAEGFLFEDEESRDKKGSDV